VLLDDKPIGTALSRNLGSPTAPGEAVESELDRLIGRRSRQRDADEESALWQESVKRYEEERLKVARLEWHAFHCGQAERHPDARDVWETYEKTRLSEDAHGATLTRALLSTSNPGA
jgi:hypothetical protein